ncbi:hypothetical protein AWM75_04560 [Aerococcus urinaehominis]|uniref:Uncharacterized protein n=1 Tax=Aerococcus urinaehominis TaxID=128944 RepID=A0A0X8FL38_9LACT|nr:AEC family transporter [Aerococcus urinaehominis]AMB99318.1 hypothetical protein AWM75_04560 [Aerococcus urinaehominis]SDM20120.1 hypothetical protein SAMN04487985_10840 [Aerococcus urinaehominis]
MAQFLQMFTIQMSSLIYLLLGIFAYRRQIITDKNRSAFIQFILNILMPIMVFYSFRKVNLEILKNGFIAIVAATIIYSLTYLIGRFIFRNYPDRQRKILEYALLVNNAGLGGQPLSGLMYGDVGLILAAMYLVPHRIFMWTLGIVILEGDDRQSSGDWVGKALRNPAIIAVAVGIIWGLLEIPLPEFIDRSFASLSAIVQPLAMIIIGSIIATVKLEKLFEKGVLVYTAWRLFLISGLVILVCRLLSLPTNLTGVLTIMTAMPAGTTTALLASQYNLDETIASKIVLVTTLLSIITVPFMMIFI